MPPKNKRNGRNAGIAGLSAARRSGVFPVNNTEEICLICEKFTKQCYDESERCNAENSKLCPLPAGAGSDQRGACGRAHAEGGCAASAANVTNADHCANIHANANSDADADTNADTDADADTNADANAEPKSYAAPDSQTHAQAHAQAEADIDGKAGKSAVRGRRREKEACRADV